jgi:hypothetical protein
LTSPVRRLQEEGAVVGDDALYEAEFEVNETEVFAQQSAQHPQ